jgi:von Willebrand factor A domain-containing protein 8
MMQKDNLKQDLFLIGRPGKFKRNIAMTYLQLTNQECEYIALSRDTSESDLKQRREISNGTSIYLDQAAVRAAKEGRVLIIDGVEKAERNILPILNNLLENREMHLEDGRFMVSAERYDNLLKEHGQEVLDKMGLVRVSNDFRVIALGLPVPKYRGSPLDPPLRSRFQARDVASLSFSEMTNQMKEAAPNAPEKGLRKLLSFGFAVASSDSSASLPDFPIDNVIEAGRILSNNPSMSEFELIQRLYPTEVILTNSQKSSIKTLMESLKIQSKPTKHRISNVEHLDGIAKVTIQQPAPGSLVSWLKTSEVVLEIPTCDQKLISSPKIENKFVEIESQSALLSDMTQTHAVADFCLIGTRGSGKTALVVEMCRMLNQPLEQITLYKDMSARELIQSRNTKANGDTEWMDSSLVKAARNGWTIVLDGLHRLHLSTMSILHRLVHDRELHLFDGSRLIRDDKFDELLSLRTSESELNAKGIFKIHPAFRIVALAEPPKLDTSNWLTPEVLSIFLFHRVENLNKSDEIKIISELYGEISPSMAKILELAQTLRTRSEKDPILKNFAEALSTRQLLRIAHRLSKYNGENVSIHDIVQRVFLSKFLPSLPRSVLESTLKEFDIVPSSMKNKEIKVFVDKEKNLLTIGNTQAPIHPHDLSHSLKVPETLFYDTPHYVQLLERILQDFLLGYHLCLIGNQGVGKNKLIDRLLFLMNYPREYIQLHRDTTVTSLTVAPTIVDGKVIFEDSPLVKAVKNGYTLVIDEIDKAPINVTCVLKSLVETGEMWLSDGRKIVSSDSKVDENDPKIIKSHPSFRTIVLANRPGFPFLGNDFFASMGHLFSCHAIDNPEMESEVQLLKQYGPNVDEKLIKKLVKAFGELRAMADTSQISYPYSTREVVNIVKHLNKYPGENISELIGNVLDFDRHAPESLEQVTNVLIKHGLEIASYAKNELAELRRQREIQMSVDHFSGKDVSAPKHGKVDEKNDPHVGGNTWAGGSGGRDTAGLGGKGGPYRLDSGHKVHQLSDAEKDAIPEDVKAAARAMNRKAFQEKLKEIEMSAYDHNLYEQFSKPVKPHINTLRNILNSLEAKAKERHWQKHQTAGELDDMKLIEGITGEKNIYKMRADMEPEPGQPQEKPKRLTVVADVSGSMYRFNGYDGRLDRQLEAVTMLMESFEGFENKIQYNIIGHSGESPCIPFVDHKNPPNNDKRRMDTLRMMHAHSQFCWSGDNTLKATQYAVDEISKEECDEAIVVVLSDANLQRYSIPPKKLTQMLMKQEPKVHAYMIFIGSLGEEAKM